MGLEYVLEKLQKKIYHFIFTKTISVYFGNVEEIVSIKQ